MPDREQTMKLIEQLAAEDETERQQAQAKLRAMGNDAISYLNMAKGQKNRYPYIEVFKMLALIGDDIFDAGQKQNKSIVDSMEFAAKRTLKSIPEELEEIGRQALTRWGMKVPEPRKPEILHCHTCKRSSTEIQIRTCFLPECKKTICEDHAAIITGGMGTWFCCEEHKQQAMKNPSILM